MGKIFCFIGKSSSGKDTIFKIISRDFPDIMEIVLYTTRPIRKGEIDGVDYHFVNDCVFQQMVEKQLVIESRSYNTQYGIWTYFTASNDIDLEHNNYMNINTLDGYRNFKEYFGEENVVPIYIQVEDGIRLERALAREKKQNNPKYEELCRRFLADQVDFSEENLALCNIQNRFQNQDLFDCVDEIEKKMLEILEKERQYQI